MGANLKMTLEYTEADGSQQTMVLYFDAFYASHARGTRRSVDTKNGVTVNIESNGQEKFKLLAWKGCSSYEAFVENELHV